MTNNLRLGPVVPEGYQFPAGQATAAVFNDAVDHNFFATFGVPIIAGRGFLETDRTGSPPVVVVNARFAQRYFGGNAVGKRVRLVNDDVWAEVVGVTVTGKHASVFEPPLDYIYRPLAQTHEARMTLTVETQGDPTALVGPLRETVRSINPNLPVFAVRTMEDIFNQRSVKVANIITGTVGMIGLVGLILALIGLYAIVAYQVSRRTREIGIRMALGAARSDVVKMVLHQAAGMSIAGVAIGITLSFFAARGINAGLTATLEGVSLPIVNTTVFALIPLALVATTLLAAAVPARRASRIEPQHALRQE